VKTLKGKVPPEQLADPDSRFLIDLSDILCLHYEESGGVNVINSTFFANSAGNGGGLWSSMVTLKKHYHRQQRGWWSLPVAIAIPPAAAPTT